MQKSNWLFVFFLLLCFGVIFVILSRVLLPWSYYALSILIAGLLATMLFRGLKIFFYATVMLAVLLWSTRLLATLFTTFFPIDAYQQFAHVRILTETGRVVLNTNEPIALLNHPSCYPLLSLLTTIISITIGIDPLHVAVSLPLAYGLANMLFVALLSSILLNDSHHKYFGLGLASLFFAMNPDANPYFYNSFFSLTLFFMLLYLLVKNARSENPELANRILFILLLVILPLSTAYIPVVAVYFFLSFTILTWGLGFLFRKKKTLGRSIKLSLVPFLLIFSVVFLWNFQVLYPSALTKAIPRYVDHLLHPRPFGFGPVQRIEGEASILIPELLKPEPFIYLLHLREIAVWILPLVFMVPTYLFLLIKRSNNSTGIIFPVCLIASFLPITLVNLYGGWTPWSFRYYALPLIVYFATVFYATFLRSKRFGVRFATSALIAFLLFNSFLAPESHVYFSRHIYDPSVKFEEVGVPDPAYVNLKRFFEEQSIEDGVILTDDRALLAVIGPQDYRLMRGFVMYWPFDVYTYYGKPNTYIIELIGLRHHLGAPSYQQEYAQQMAQIRTSVYSDYSKILDSHYYSIYYKP